MKIKNENFKNEIIKNKNSLVELSSEELRLVAGGDCMVDPGSSCGVGGNGSIGNASHG